jgi:hypothetical protein
VVQDATAPYIKDKPICNVRLVYPSLNLKAATDAKQTSQTVLFFANDIDHLPLVIRTSDILRVTRCTVSSWKGTKQLNSNVWNKSQWTVFRGHQEIDHGETATADRNPSYTTTQQQALLTEVDYKPISISQYKYSWHAESEEPIVQSLRDWFRAYFKQWKAYSL